MTFVINVPEWGIWVVAGMVTISTVVNIWHGIVVRKYLRRSGRG